MGIKKIVVFLILIFSSLEVHATKCIYGSLSVTLPKTFIYQEASAGMMSTSWHEASDASLLNCDVTGAGKFEITNKSPLVASGVYSFGGTSYTPLQSSVSNISFIMEIADTKGGWKPYQGQPVTTYENTGSMSSTFGIKVRVRLIATGRLEPGSYALPAGDLINTGVTQAELYTDSGITRTTATIITSKSPTCKLSMAAKYALPKIDLSEISKVSSTAGTTGVSFSATCGGASSAYSVKYSMVDMNASVAGADYVTLRSVDGKGLESVGLQLTDGAAAMLMGTVYSLGQVPAAGGTLSKTLQVSYVRRAMTSPSPGSVSGEVALILSYD
ncbi:fimbrial protein [Pseudomonas sp. FSL W5-0203]|uniref:fimbrial protein n=1 Tax=Pseudomonas sp. FSL W5-0203 TaxID=1920491 RepID=UPI000937C117|nr:fimbrial protein [Pseudomonas sp. FSL W5-0203]